MTFCVQSNTVHKRGLTVIFSSLLAKLLLWYYALKIKTYCINHDHHLQQYVLICKCVMKQYQPAEVTLALKSWQMVKYLWNPTAFEVQLILWERSLYPLKGDFQLKWYVMKTNISAVSFQILILLFHTRECFFLFPFFLFPFALLRNCLPSANAYNTVTKIVFIYFNWSEPRLIDRAEYSIYLVNSTSVLWSVIRIA